MLYKVEFYICQLRYAQTLSRILVMADNQNDALERAGRVLDRLGLTKLNRWQVDIRPLGGSSGTSH